MKPRYASIIVLLSSVVAVAGYFGLGEPAQPKPSTTHIQVVVPVPPLRSVLNAFIDQSKVQVESLVAPGGDVHHVHLSPSQLRRLKTADIAIPEMAEGDPHIWLALNGVRGFALHIAGQLDPKSQAAVQSFLAARATWLAQQQDRFVPLQGVPFIVDHDAFQGFESDLGLQGKLGALTTGHDQAIGAKSLRTLRAKAAGKRVCVLHRPGADIERLATLLEGIDLTFMEADPLLWNDPSYANGMTRLADAFYACLSEATP